MRKLRPMDEIYDPAPIAAADVYGVGTLGGFAWYSDKVMALPGEPPKGAQPAKADYDFGEWVTGRKFAPMKPTGWTDEGDGVKVVEFLPPFADLSKPGHGRNFMSVRYHRIAYTRGARVWEMRDDGEIIACRDEDGGLVAMVSPMRLTI